MDAATNFNDDGKREKLLLNGLLFCMLRGHSDIADKLRNIEEYLTKGADVNATDANDDNNTPLHIAVEMDEPDIVRILLKYRANVDAKNKNIISPLDLAKMSEKQNKMKIVEILKPSKDIEFTKVNNSDTGNTKPKKTSVFDSEKDKETRLACKGRPGTAGIRGQLYEIKLIGLLLHRALNDKEIDKFYLGSNVEGLGALDDIVLKYYLKNDRKPKIFFIQAKHKDNLTKAKLMLDSVLRTNDDFSLDKYFESYMKIQQKLRSKNNRDPIFQNEQTPDLSFIIYTPVLEQFEKKKFIEILGKETLTYTSDKGKVFMYKYDDKDVETLLKNIMKSRAVSLSQKFAKNIAKAKYNSMMWDDLINVYRVFLMKNVVQICDVREKYLIGIFRKSFLESEDEILILIKKTIFKELKMLDKLSENASNFSFEFKLPKNFGNTNMLFNEDDFGKVLEKLMTLIQKTDHSSFIRIDDSMVGKNKILSKTDKRIIKNLVGETLVLDNVTGYLKLNTEDNATEITKIVMDKVKLFMPENTIKNLRFDINIQNFPQLSLCKMNHDKNMVIIFLEKLIFCTDQADEEGVEKILKNEIFDKYISESNKHKYFCNIKSDAIYLQYLDKILNWWKKPEEYLTDTCKFYEESKKLFIDSPLVTMYSYVYMKKISDYNINFDKKIVNFLQLQNLFTNSNVNILHIKSTDSILSSIKVFQFFRDVQKSSNFVFIDLDHVRAEVSEEVILKEISISNKDVIMIIVLNDTSITNMFIQNIQKLIKKVILISRFSSSQVNSEDLTCLEQVDEDNGFSDLDSKTKQRIYEQNKILFQGFEVYLNSIIDEQIEPYLDRALLHKVISSNIIKIGKELKLIDNNYYNNNDFYIKRYLCRCININWECRSVVNVIEPKDTSSKAIKGINYEIGKDVLVISYEKTLFEEVCKESNNVNIHWFQRKDSDKLHWVKSYGSLKTLRPYIKKIQCFENMHCSYEPKTLRDINDKVVIISGQPGIGKSSLVSHLMMQTKLLDKSMCVIKINLQDLANEFSKWRERDNETKLKWLLLIIYRAFHKNNTDVVNKEINEELVDVLNCLSFTDNRVYLNSENTIKIVCQFDIFEFRVFLNMYNTGKVTIILDGFDEVFPDYKKETIEVCKELINSRIIQLLITSRCYSILDELEIELNTISYSLKYLTNNDQIEFLKKLWRRNFTEQFELTDDYVQHFLIAISRKMKSFYNTLHFTSTPLHLHMIAETYKTSFNNSYFSISTYPKFDYPCNLITLYEKFIDIKFYKIRFGEKTNCLCSKHPDIKKVIERMHDDFLENHKVLAAYALIQNNIDANILTEDDVTHSLELIQKFNSGEEKTGIIGSIFKNKPRFVHFTFAEYFFCEFICDKLKQNNEEAWKYLYGLLIDDKKGIRGFFDAKLEIDRVLSKLTSKSLCDSLLSHQNVSSETALNYAVSENHTNIAIFVLNNLDTYLQNSNLDDFMGFVSEKGLFPCFLQCTHDERNLIIMERIIKIIIRLDCSNLVKLFYSKNNTIMNIFVLAFIQKYPLQGIMISEDIKAVMDMLVQHIKLDDLTDLLTTPLIGAGWNRTILHYKVVIRSKNLYLENIIKKLNPEQCYRVFSARDEVGKLPAHYAAENNNINFFYIMASYMEKDHYISICTTQDSYGVIPFMYFNRYFLNTDEFKSICATASIDYVQVGNTVYLKHLENILAMLTY